MVRGAHRDRRICRRSGGPPYSRVSNRTFIIRSSDAGGERTSGVPLDFSGRVAIVTGAARGLGRAAAERLYERGAGVVVNVRDAARAEAFAGSLGEREL